MSSEQSDLFADGLLRLDASRAPLGLPILAGRPVSLVELPFGYGVDLRALRRLCHGADTARALRIVERLQQLGAYKIRQARDRGARYTPMVLRLARVELHVRHGETLELLVLPKGQLPHIITTFASQGVPAAVEARSTTPADISSLTLPFLNGHSLDKLQRGVLGAALETCNARLIDFPMGGGKSLMIAATLRAFPQLRPALVTGDSVNDTAQIALTLSEALGEPVCLLGCTGGLSTSVRRQRLLHEREWRRAPIIVATHDVLHHVKSLPLPVDSAESTGAPQMEICRGLPPQQSPAPKKQNAELGFFLAGVKLLIADEVDSLPTLRNLQHLIGMNPDRFYGFTGTWGHRADRMDSVLIDSIGSGGVAQVVVRAVHNDLVDSGRVLRVGLNAYEFSENEYPQRIGPPPLFHTPSLAESTVIHHDGRNRFCAELLRHVIQIAAGGVTIAYVKTIEHSFEVLRHYCAIEGLPCDETALRAAGIFLHNAQLPRARRIENLDAIRRGKAKLVISTDTLAVGFDCPSISETVDLTGMQEKRHSLQRAGRTVRQAPGKSGARYHFVWDTHHPGLVMISRRKRETLERHFGRRAILFRADCLPWRRPPHESLSDDLILSELTR